MVPPASHCRRQIRTDAVFPLAGPDAKEHWFKATFLHFLQILHFFKNHITTIISLYNHITVSGPVTRLCQLKCRTFPLTNLLEVSIEAHLAAVKIYVYKVPYDLHQTENTPTNDSMYANTHGHADGSEYLTHSLVLPVAPHPRRSLDNRLFNRVNHSFKM